MILPHDLSDQIKLAWPGPPPTLPEKWRLQDQEFGDAFRLFNGRGYTALSCDSLPRYYDSLLLMRQDCPNAANYYLASYLTCYFSSSGDTKVFVEMVIENFLLGALDDPRHYDLTSEMCGVISTFLQATADELEWSCDLPIPTLWGKILFGKKMQKLD